VDSGERRGGGGGGWGAVQEGWGIGVTVGVGYEKLSLAELEREFRGYNRHKGKTINTPPKTMVTPSALGPRDACRRTPWPYDNYRASLLVRGDSSLARRLFFLAPYAPSPILNAAQIAFLPALLHEHGLLPEANRRAF